MSQLQNNKLSILSISFQVCHVHTRAKPSTLIKVSKKDLRNYMGATKYYLLTEIEDVAGTAQTENVVFQWSSYSTEQEKNNSCGHLRSGHHWNNNFWSYMK